MKRSVEFRISASQHVKDRKRAEQALGHPLKRSQPVHHFTETQLVICEDAKYHALLHELSYYKRLESDSIFADAEIARVEASTARILEEIRLLRLIVEKHRPGSSALIDAAIEAMNNGATFAEASALVGL